jgi:hypothetical protein
MVHHVWRAHGLKPHITKTFKPSNDKNFAEKMVDVVGPQGAWDRYLFPTHAVHFQFQYGSSAVELITYMTLGQARRVTEA